MCVFYHHSGDSCCILLVTFNEFVSLTPAHDFCRTVSRLGPNFCNSSRAALHTILSSQELRKNCVVYTHERGYSSPMRLAIATEAYGALQLVCGPDWFRFETGMTYILHLY